MDTPQNKIAPARTSLILVIVFALVSLFMSELPVLSIIFVPVQYFTTALHEIGHALACNATGGSVTGMTIVSDGQGHGGLTYCLGGQSLIFGQTGYLGTTLFGCLMLWLSSYQKATRGLLGFMAVLLAFAALVYINPALATDTNNQQATVSMVVALVMAGALFMAARFAPLQIASLVVLFLSVQTALNALSDIGVLIQLNLGLYGVASFSDATNMAKQTHIPAIIWSLGWGITSVFLLFVTLRRVYGKAKGDANQ